jgi:phosphoribosylamine--glycine ligase
MVVKADGLAAGKGVIVCADPTETKRALSQMLEERAFGAAGQQVVIEEFLVGREATLMALVDGECVTPLVPSEDHKQRDDGDAGPMTGGMGVVSPTPTLDDLTTARVVRDVLEPTARGLCSEGRSFRGLLYTGLMLTDRGPRVLEYNCRFGDPETQAVLMRCDEDLGATLHAIATGRPVERVRFGARAAVCVVMTAPGYPGDYPTGSVIEGLDRAAAVEGVAVFHAGTRRDAEGRVVTSGGRVLGVTATGENAFEARRRAYAAVQQISFEGAHWRRDIGARRMT